LQIGDIELPVLHYKRKVVIYYYEEEKGMTGISFFKLIIYQIEVVV